MEELPALKEFVEVVRVDLKDKEHFSTEFVLHNPLKKVPCLYVVATSEALMESTAICFYLLDNFCVPYAIPRNFYATSGFQRARLHELAAFSVTAELQLQEGSRQLMPHHTKAEDRNLAVVEKAVANFRALAVPFLLQRLKGPFYEGAEFSLADIFVGFLLQFAIADFWIEKPLNDPTLLAYLGRVCSRPPVLALMTAERSNQ